MYIMMSCMLSQCTCKTIVDKLHVYQRLWLVPVSLLLSRVAPGSLDANILELLCRTVPAEVLELITHTHRCIVFVNLRSMNSYHYTVKTGC